jgi:two-component system phosphate regulon sensor histidine kinase PhoR
MLKIRINLVITSVWIAIFALLLIQIFQTLQLYDRKSDDFKSKINTVLERIALRYEKIEDVRKYRSLMEKDVADQYKDVLKEEFQNLFEVQESIEIKDTVLNTRGYFEKYLLVTGKSYDSITGLYSKQEVLARDVRHVRDLLDGDNPKLFHEDSVKAAYHLDQRVTNRIIRKAKYINEVMVQTFRDNLYQNPSERVNVFELDSIIHKELLADKLPDDYQFSISDEYSQPVKFARFPSCYQLKVDTSSSQMVLLFPNKILDDKLFLHVFFPKSNVYVFKSMGSLLIVSLTLAVLILIALTFMLKTILSQEKLHTIKNDFISNMTHEFKTPISTISLACEAMSDKDMMGGDTSASAPFVRMIRDENKRLSVLVESILQSAVLDRGELKLKIEKVPVLEVIRSVAESATFRIANVNGKLILRLPSDEVYLQTDRLHFTNLVNNLIDNAIKYSKENIDVTVSLEVYDDHLELSVADKGIGIKKEHISKIFDKLYRIPTGNVHNVKGFGLGLSYVKAIADLFKWNIKVTSQFGEGTEFRILIRTQ